MEAAYEEYLERASKEYDVPLEILVKILEIEREKQYMKRRHNIYSDLRKVILDAVREQG